MTIEPSIETIGIVDIELVGDDYHHMFIKRMDDKHLMVDSTRCFELNQSYTFRFSLPVVDWIFEAQGVFTMQNEIKGSNDEKKFELIILLQNMDAQDQAKLHEFIQMYNEGKIEIKDIL